MCGPAPPAPSSASDCTASKDGAHQTCVDKDQEIELVELVEVYKLGGKWKQRAVDSRKQYINLDWDVDAAKDHPEYGRPVWLKARVQWASGDKSRSLSGKAVYWYSKADGVNKAGLAKNEQESFGSAGGGTVKKADSVDKDGWTQPLPFYLSLYGGDKFDVYVTLDKGYKGGLKAGAYEVWRKFWFQVSEMIDRAGTGKYDLPAAVTTAIVSGYEGAKVVFEEKGPRGKIPHQGNTPTSGMDKLGSAHFVVDDLVPFKCHLMTCDYGGQSTEEKSVNDKMTGKTWTSPGWFMLWPHDGALAWKVSAQYQDGKTWKDIPDAKLSSSAHATQPGFQKVKVNFTGGPVTPAAKAPVSIKFKLKCAGPSFFLGWGGGRAHILLCTGMLRDINEPADRDPMQRSDAVHEIGHALGLVNMTPSKAKAHDAWHDTTHSNHCTQPSNKCAMFWQSSTTRATTFHSIGGAGCNEHLRTQDFSRSVMKPLWK